MTDRIRLTRSPGPNAVTAVLALAGATASFMMTIVLPIQSQLPDLLDVSRDDAAWVITSTTLAAAVATPIAGRLGDMVGKRRIALVLLAVMVVGSIVAALSTSIVPLIVGRAMQGVVIGVIPLGISILRDTLAPSRLPSAIALVSATLGFGGAVALPISALITENADWHALFWLAAGLGAVNLALIAGIVPVSTLRSPGRFDLPGAIGLSLGLLGVLVAISRGDQWGWTSAGVLGLGLGGLALLALWGVYELRVRDALVDLRVAARPAVLLTNLASVAIGFSFFASQVAYPQLLELPVATGVGLGLSLLAASLVLMPSGLAMVAMSPVAARLNVRIGPKFVLIVGAALIVGAYVLSYFLITEVWQLLLVNVIVGLGLGLSYAAMPTLVMRAVPATETAAANGLNALMRSLGTSVAAATVGAVLATFAVPFGDTQVPTLEGFRLAFVLGGAAGVVSILFAAFIPTASEESRPALPETGPVGTLDSSGGARGR